MNTTIAFFAGMVGSLVVAYLWVWWVGFRKVVSNWIWETNATRKRVKALEEDLNDFRSWRLKVNDDRDEFRIKHAEAEKRWESLGHKVIDTQEAKKEKRQW